MAFDAESISKLTVLGKFTKQEIDQLRQKIIAVLAGNQDGRDTWDGSVSALENVESRGPGSGNRSHMG
jgi:hypothetical protein